jgi:hypothetical protein
MIAAVQGDLRPWGDLKPPHWRFCVHPAVYTDLEFLAAADPVMRYDAASGRMGLALDRNIIDQGLRLFGLLVVPAADVDRDAVELRYTYRQDLPKATDDPDYTGDRRPHP